MATKKQPWAHSRRGWTYRNLVNGGEVYPREWDADPWLRLKSLTFFRTDELLDIIFDAKDDAEMLQVLKPKARNARLGAPDPTEAELAEFVGGAEKLAEIRARFAQVPRSRWPTPRDLELDLGQRLIKFWGLTRGRKPGSKDGEDSSRLKDPDRTDGLLEAIQNVLYAGAPEHLRSEAVAFLGDLHPDVLELAGPKAGTLSKRGLKGAARAVLAEVEGVTPEGIRKRRKRRTEKA